MNVDFMNIKIPILIPFVQKIFSDVCVIQVMELW